MSIITLEHIRFSFSSKQLEEISVLKDINITVNTGEFHVITGPSGSGKTTLLQITATFLQPESGKQKIFGKDIELDFSLQNLSSIRRKIGYLFQTPFIPPNLTVKEYVVMQSSLSGIGLRTAKENADKILTDLGINQFSANYPTSLSGGEKQRVALAGILAKNVELLLLDEPTGSLDSENKTIFWELISKLKEENMTIIVATHSSEITNYADFLHVLKNGSLEKN
ncbi:MAG TPA: ABC transporter ATP-binding protein [candidate division Zixibacteria bacterium]|nr:ABC transporter ATP-binding protein [candidate division Zixibacteria bacterium]